MMKLLIVAYHCPPCTLTPANRAFSWVKYLPQHGIYPIVVTRHWDDDINHPNYSLKAVDKPLHIEKGDGFEIHRLPHLGNFRTNRPVEVRRWYNRFFTKAYYAIELLLQNFFPQILSYHNIFGYTKKLAKQENVDQLLITGSPFQLFKIGYDVFKQHNIPWIADYRDGWSVGTLKSKLNLIEQLMVASNRFFERKWMSAAKAFTTVSPYISKQIEAFTGITGHVVYNGYFENQIERNKTADRTQIAFLFNGAIYQGQDYVGFVEVLKELYEKYKDQIKVNCIFLGTTFINLPFANNPVFKGTEGFIQKLDRVDYSTSQSYYAKADVLLMFGFSRSKGQVSSKIFDYLQQQKPILLYKGDDDILSELLTKSNLGSICESKEQMRSVLEEMIQTKMENGFLQAKPNIQFIEQYSRENQAKEMARVLKLS